jgi:hypothetical protein
MSGRPGWVSTCSTQALRSCSIASSSLTQASGPSGGTGRRWIVRRRQPGARRPPGRAPGRPLRPAGGCPGSKGHLSPGWRRPQDEDPPPACRDPRPRRPAVRRSSRPRPAGRSRTSRSWTRVPLRDSRFPPVSTRRRPPGPARRALCAAWVLVIHAVLTQLRLVTRLDPEPLPRTEERLPKRSSEGRPRRVPGPPATGYPSSASIFWTHPDPAR